MNTLRLTTFVCQMLQHKQKHRQLTLAVRFLHLRLIQISTKKKNRQSESKLNSGYSTLYL